MTMVPTRKEIKTTQEKTINRGEGAETKKTSEGVDLIEEMSGEEEREEAEVDINQKDLTNMSQKVK